MRRAIAIACLLSGCAAPRFADRPPVWRVDDARDIPKPESVDYYRYAYMADIFLLRRLTRALELSDSDPAESTNSWDEVPDSTWFTNRIGVRELTAQEVAVGPLEGPDPQLPLTVVSAKSGGGNPGFVARDGLGRRFLVKFDPKENPEMQTATDVIVSRLFWAIGYHVPQDRVFTFCAEDVEIEEGATAKDALGRKEPFTRAILDDILGQVAKRADGCFRALGSQYLDGVPIGGVFPEGVRADDPNDTIPHEKRRELRGLRVFAAWLNHTDMKEDNTLDMWVEEDGRHFVRHYFVDFGEALAAHAAEKGRYEDGYEHYFDWQIQPLAFLSLGLWVRPWERIRDTRWLSVGAFTADPFDPKAWREAYPFWPFMDADEADAYWGAKIVMRFTRPMLEAVIAEAKLSNPAAATYLADALYERRRIIGQTYLEAVTPLDEFRVEGEKLCMVDQSVRFQIANAGVVELLNDRDLPAAEYTVDGDGAVCIPLDPGGDYEILRLRTRRGAHLRPPMQLHVKAGRLLGVVRIEEWSSGRLRGP